MITTPAYGDPSLLACTALGVRFKETKLPTVLHRVSDHPGTKVILVAFIPYDSMVTLTYVNPENVILKRLSYSRESILELDMSEGICRLVLPPPRPVTPIKGA